MKSNDKGHKLTGFVKGDRVETTARIAWTIGVFEDYPFVAESGEKATIVDIDVEGQILILLWDSDKYSSLPKELRIQDATKLKQL